MPMYLKDDSPSSAFLPLKLLFLREDKFLEFKKMDCEGFSKSSARMSESTTIGFSWQKRGGRCFIHYGKFFPYPYDLSIM